MSHTPWGIGLYSVELTADYEESMGNIRVEITNSLNEDFNNESIGIGNVEFISDATPGVEMPAGKLAFAGEDWDHTNCNAWTKKECGDFQYWGGVNECGHSAVISKTIPQSDLG
jgi:hypothetical protein